MKNGRANTVARNMPRRRAAVTSNTSSMLPTQGAGKVQANVTSRTYLSNSRRYLSQNVLSTTQSLYGVGSTFTQGTLTFSAEQLSAAAQVYIQNYDKYKITGIEIFVTMGAESLNGSVDKNVPVNLWFYEDTDCDSGTQTSWTRVRDRRNLGMVSLNAFTPTKRLLSFQPTPSFDTQTTLSQSPANIVPRKGQWIDALNLAQQMAGFRFFAACPQQDSGTASYRWNLNFTARYTIMLTQPI